MRKKNKWARWFFISFSDINAYARPFVHGRNNKYVNVNMFSKRIRNKSNFITSGDTSNADSSIEFDLCFARSVDSTEGNTNGFMIGDSIIGRNDD